MKKRKFNTTTIILEALILGVIAGLVLGEKAAALQPIGTIYLNLIKMVVIPLVMCSIISAITNVNDMGKLGRVGVQMFILYAVTSGIAAAMGVTVASVAKLGSGLSIPAPEQIAHAEAAGFWDVLYGFVSPNICESMAKFDTLPCIVFSAIFGIAIIMAGPKADAVKNWVGSMSEIFYGMINIILKAAPIGVFSLVASSIGLYGVELLTTFGIFIVLQAVAGTVLLIIYLLLLKSSGVGPFKFIKCFSKVAIMAFTTRSSAASLPLNIKTTVEELEARSDIANFTMPIGATINMNGAALSMAMRAVMASYLFGIHLAPYQLFVAVVLSVISGMGMSSVPNAGIVFDLFTYNTLGLPAEMMIGLTSGIGNFTDMIDTVFNVMGDSVCAILISKSEERYEEKHA